VIDWRNILTNYRTFIQIIRHKMRGSSDNFHPTIKGLLVRLRPNKRGQKGQKKGQKRGLLSVQRPLEHANKGSGLVYPLRASEGMPRNQVAGHPIGWGIGRAGP